MSIAADGSPIGNAAARAPGERPGLIFAVVTIALSLFLWSVAEFQVLVLIPRVAKILDEFRMRVSLTTELVINHAYWILPATIVLSVIVCIFLRSRWVWALVLIALPLCFNVVLLVNTHGPLLDLLDGLAGSVKK